MNLLYRRAPFDRRPPSPGSFSPTRSEGMFQSARYKMEAFFPLWMPKGDPGNSGNYFDRAGDPFTGGWTNRWLPLGGNPYDWWGVSGNRGIRFNTTGQAQTTGSSSGVSVPASRSIMCCFTVKTYPTADNFRHVWGIGGGGAWLCDFGFDDRGYCFFYEVTGGAVQLFSDPGLVTLNRTHGVVCVSDNSVGMSIWLNGRKVASNGSTGFLTLGSTTLAANINSSPFVGSGHDYTLHTSGYWPRKLSDLEAAAVSANPFGLMRTSDRMYVPTLDAGGVGGGGGSHRRWTAIAA